MGLVELAGKFYRRAEEDLIRFAKQVFYLRREENGLSIGEHLRQVERATGFRPPELNIAPPQYGFDYLWTWFTELDNRRGSSGFGPNPVSFMDIQAWALLTGRSPSPWEVRVLCTLDNENMREAADAVRSRKK